MRTRTVVGLLVAGFVMLISSRPASAQGMKVDFAAGYQLLSYDGDMYDFPLGWGASFGAGKDRIKFVADVGGHYGGGDPFHAVFNGDLYTVQGGLEVSSHSKRVVPFARMLAGLPYFSQEDSFAALALTPEVGLKIMASDRIGVQLAVGFPFLLAEDTSKSTARLFAGVVYRK
jgi:hypothetical protein